jgi:catechol 2,3-dioxygenase-like lactoylglutathione lyase family enzyme
VSEDDIRTASRSTAPETARESGLVFEHVGLVVSDLNRSLEFYMQVIGFSVLRRTDVNAYLYLGTELLELIQAVDPAVAPVPTGQYPHRLNGPGNMHLGFRVPDMVEALSRLELLGGELISPPRRWEQNIEFAADVDDDKLKRAARPIGNSYWTIAVLRDPDGAMLELVER